MTDPTPAAVERFDFGAHYHGRPITLIATKHSLGKWISASAYDALAQQVAALTKDRDFWANDCDKRWKDAVAERDALQATIPAQIAAARVEMRKRCVDKYFQIAEYDEDAVTRALECIPIPDTDALQSALDRAFDEGVEAAANLVEDYSNCVPRHKIRALKRSGKGG